MSPKQYQRNAYTGCEIDLRNEHGAQEGGPGRPKVAPRVVTAMVAGRRRWVERMKAEGRKFPGGYKLGAKVVKAAKQTFVVQLPRQYRHMTFDEFVEAAKKVLKQKQERLERTGRLIG